MDLLGAMQLGYMRAMADAQMTDTCTIEAEDLSVGQMGEPTRSWSVVAAGVACRVIMPGAGYAGATAGLVGAQETIRDSYRLIVPYGTALAINQRVTVGGSTYHITRLITERTDETDAQAIMERARGGG